MCKNVCFNSQFHLHIETSETMLCKKKMGEKEESFHGIEKSKRKNKFALAAELGLKL